MHNEKSENDLSHQIRINPNPTVRIILLTAGIILTITGILGMFIPLLPTTIFFILAAWCYARSSEIFYNWLHNNRFFGKYLTDYRIKNGMTISSKVFSISFLWVGIIVSCIFATTEFYVRIILIMIAIGVTWHLLAIKTVE